MKTNSVFACCLPLVGFLFLPTCTIAADHVMDGSVIKIDGSSTVYPITEAVAEEFGNIQGDVQITVGISGTGGGFKKFCANETEISDASRPIKQAEVDLCTKNGVEYIELPVAYDALSVVVNPRNTWAMSMTVAELKKLWAPEAQGRITKWSQIREGWPDTTIKLFGAGVDSGTYDYFTDAIVGKEHSSRGDFTSSEDDNVLVQGISGDVNALGFLGYAYVKENPTKLRAVAIDDENASNGASPQLPSVDTVLNGTYQPLSRPLLIYVNKQALAQPAVSSFVSFYLKQAGPLSSEVGYVSLPDKIYTAASERVASGTTGSVFAGGGSKVGVTLDQLYSTEQNARAAMQGK